VLDTDSRKWGKWVLEKGMEEYYVRRIMYGGIRIAPSFSETHFLCGI
jgi:hypothetical protein